MRNTRPTDRIARLARGLFIAAITLSAAASAATVTVDINNFAFGQANATVTVAVGDTVKWNNIDADAHTVTSGVRDGAGSHPDGRFDSGNLDPGASYSVTFHTAGTFPYYCLYHGSMVSAIRVTAPATTWAVNIQGFAFIPSDLTIVEGDSVTWTNKDVATHTATSGVSPTADGKFNTGNIVNGGSKTLTFDTAGIYPYFCFIHKGMKANLTVTAPPMRGDVNGDGAVTMADAAELERIAGGLSTYDVAKTTYYDVYPVGFGDGTLDVRDVCHLVRFLGGADPTL
ncbi:MAG TPA: plastocyanin/azurin family copper-binding protein [Armatimonadota bacterium]|jgi:plastocyanin